MANVKGIRVQVLGISIRHSVHQQILDDCGSLNGPTSVISRGIDLLSLCLFTDTSGVFDKGYDGLECEDVVQEFHGLGDGHALDVVGDLASVLEVHTEVGSSCLGGTGCLVGGFYTVTNHNDTKILHGEKKESFVR
jgi:hypothetical protein